LPRFLMKAITIARFEPCIGFLKPNTGMSKNVENMFNALISVCPKKGFYREYDRKLI
jgi:hypothetical protein